MNLTILIINKTSYTSMSTFRRLSVKKIVNQHCAEDLACLHHCQCWELHKKQYEIKLTNLMAKYEEAKKQLDFQTKLNIQMVKELEVFRKKAAKYKNIQAMKEDFRKQLQQQIYKQKQVEDTLMKQKISDLEAELKRNNIRLQKIQQQYFEIKEQRKKLQIQLDEARRGNQILQEQNEELRQENEQLQKKQDQYYGVIVNHQKTIDEKTLVIEELRKSIYEIEGRFMLEKAKASSLGTEKDVLEINIKNKDKYIDSLTRCSQQNLKNLQNIQENNKDLKNLVGALDCEVMAGRMNELYFRDRLIQSEERLAVSQGLAAYNNQKVQLMKNDLHLLKLTI